MKKLELNKETVLSLTTTDIDQVQAGMAPLSHFGCETCGYVCGDCVSASIVLRAQA